ncbi:ABC transporter ATP-binding protein/permease [Candidatus Saccharibacteria bacterium]|nr:ABC transporter ATP-binding protein/permease [Candidatus Saccharibacteria bacterium]
MIRYFLRHWWRLIFLFAGLILQVWASLELPSYMADIINRGIVAGDQSIIWQIGYRMLLVAAIGGVGMVISGFMSSKIAALISAQIRQDIFTKVLELSITDVESFSTASLITRTTNDVSQISSSLVMLLRLSLQAPIMAVGAILMALQTAPSITWIMALSVASLLVIIISAMLIVLPKFKIMQTALDRLNQIARENLTGLRVIRAFNSERREEQRFEKANQHFAGIGFFTAAVMSTTFPLVWLVMSLTSLAIVWFGSHQIAASNLEIGNMMAFLQYAMQVILAFMFLSMAFVILPRAIVSWKRIREVLDRQPQARSTSTRTEGWAHAAPLLQVHDVSYRYGTAEESTIKNVSFDLQAGQTLAILGGTGSGKTTLINLIAGLQEACQGQITLRGTLGLIPQKNLLFKGTVRENLKLGAKLSDAQLSRALQNACAADFLELSLADPAPALKTEIAQNGTNFSGGQRQRLCIARALARDPDLLIFDDSFSALDLKTDALLRANLKKHYHNTAQIIVAQRISTIKTADQILVLDAGRVVGFGTHAELLRSNQTYQEIAASQMSEAEYAAERKAAQ